MYRPPRPQMPHMGWGHHRPPFNPQWRHPGGPRGPFPGQRQRFHQPRQPFQPVNDNFWCETCDRGFPTEDILNKHKEQHQKCNIDGCQFIAHPKVITKHIQMQHSTGLYKKIANLKNPEEIEKWREERRKRYPTKSNIDKKAAELKEKIERGEKMGLERERRHRDKSNSEYQNKSGPNNKRKSNLRNENQPRSKVRKNNYTNNNTPANKSAKPKPNLQNTSTDDNKLKPFAGILNLQMSSDEEIENDTTLNDLIEDDDAEIKSVEINKLPDNQTEPVVCGALSALMCEYGSSDEENSEVAPEFNVKELKQPQGSENVNTKELPDVSHKNTSVGLSNSINNPRDAMPCNAKIIDEPINRNESVCITHSIQQNKDPTDVNNETDLKSNDVLLESGKTLATAINCYEITEKETLMKSQEYEVEIKQSAQETAKGEESDSGPEEVKAEINKVENIPKVSNNCRPKDTRKRVTRVQTHAYQRKRPKLPSTLLQKLLSKEMQQERNIVLQCIRFIRRNNYFDKKE